MMPKTQYAQYASRKPRCGQRPRLHDEAYRCSVVFGSCPKHYRIGNLSPNCWRKKGARTCEMSPEHT